MNCANEERRSGQVDVWYYRWDADPSPDLAATLYDSLSPRERERHARSHFERDRHIYLLAHGLLRRALSRYAPVRAEAWQFDEDAHGKPFVASPAAGLHFSLTHTAGMVACAIGLHSEIGVDAERIDRTLDLLSLARRFFAPGEVHSLESVAASLQNERFFTLWTLKEAYVKARGLGLRLPLADFEVRPQRGEAAAIAFLDGTPSSDWHLRVFRPASSHIVSAAVRMAEAPQFRLRDGSGLL